MGKSYSITEKGTRKSVHSRSASVIERKMLFYIELFEESSAYYMAARLQKEHWEINVVSSGSSWICLAQALARPDNKTIRELCDYLSDLAEFYGGSFQRWELDSTP